MILESAELWLGRAALVVGGVILVAAFVLGACELVRRAYKNVRGIAWVMKAMRHYQKIEPSPDRE